MVLETDLGVSEAWGSASPAVNNSCIKGTGKEGSEVGLPWMLGHTGTFYRPARGNSVQIWALQ